MNFFEHRSIKIEISVGDITFDHSDVIVNFINRGTSSFITKAAGPEVIKELNQQLKNKENPQTFEITSAGKIKLTKAIFHTMLPLEKNGFETFVTKIVENAKNDYTSIAIPYVSPETTLKRNDLVEWLIRGIIAVVEKSEIGIIKIFKLVNIDINAGKEGRTILKRIADEIKHKEKPNKTVKEYREKKPSNKTEEKPEKIPQKEQKEVVKENIKKVEELKVEEDDDDGWVKVAPKAKKDVEKKVEVEKKSEELEKVKEIEKTDNNTEKSKKIITKEDNKIQMEIEKTVESAEKPKQQATSNVHENQPKIERVEEKISREEEKLPENPKKAFKNGPNIEKASFIYKNVKISIVHGNIVKETTDAIVNCANNELWLGGGVAGAIRSAAGPIIEQECFNIVKSRGSIPTGEVARTSAGDMISNGVRYVIHAVGPVWKNGKSKEQLHLKNCVINCLNEYNDIETIAIPAISSGIFGFPKELCADIMIKTAIECIDKNSPAAFMKEIKFTNLDNPTVAIFLQELEKVKKHINEMNNHKVLEYKGCKLRVLKGDIALEISDVIVNSTNESLDWGSELSQSIRKAAGESIVKFCKEHLEKSGIVKDAEVIKSPSGNLEKRGIKFIFHVNGPIWNGGSGNAEGILRTAVRNILEKCQEVKANSISIPAISSGISGFPKEICAKILVEESISFLEKGEKSLKEIKFTNFDYKTCEIFDLEFENKKGMIEDLKEVERKQESEKKQEVVEKKHEVVEKKHEGVEKKDEVVEKKHEGEKKQEGNKKQDKAKEPIVIEDDEEEKKGKGKKGKKGKKGNDGNK